MKNEIPTNDDDYSEARHDPINLAKWRSELSSVGWTGLIPFRNFFTDKPWTLIWVQFLAFAFGFPFLLMGYYRESTSTLVEAAWAFGVYFSVIWAVLIHRCLRPDPIGPKKILGTWFATSIVGVLAVFVVSAIASFLPGARDVISASESASMFSRLFGMTVGVGLVEETAKLLPVLWVARTFGKNTRPTTFAYLGVISGLAFGATEAIIYSFTYAAGHASSQIGYGDYLIIQLLRLVSLPFLHAIWAGTTAYFAGLAAINPSARRVVILAGLLAVALLHGTYNTFSDSWLGFVIAMVSFALFIGYVRDEKTGIRAVADVAE